MKSLVDVETLKQLTKESLAANLDYHHRRAARLRQEMEEAQYLYHLNMSVYLWTIDLERRMKDG